MVRVVKASTALAMLFVALLQCDAVQAGGGCALEIVIPEIYLAYAKFIFKITM